MQHICGLTGASGKENADAFLHEEEYVLLLRREHDHLLDIQGRKVGRGWRAGWWHGIWSRSRTAGYLLEGLSDLPSSLFATSFLGTFGSDG